MDKSKLTLIKKFEYPQSNEYPAETVAFELYSNADTMGIILFLKLKNTCGKGLDFIRLKISYYDSESNLLGTKYAEYDKLDANASKFFGDNKAIEIPSLRTDSVSVMVQKAVFDDKSVWQCADDIQNTAEIPSDEIKTALSSAANINPWDKNTPEEKRLKKRRTIRSVIIAAVLCAAALTAYFVINGSINQKTTALESAVKAYTDGDYQTAKQLLDELLDKKLSGNTRQKAVLYRAFTAIHTENYITAAHYLNALNGSENAALYLRRLNAALSGIAAAGEKHTVALKKDGHVLSAGSNEYGQCGTAEWNDVIAVASGKNHTLGLKSDGTVYASGDNSAAQCTVSEWKNISAVAAGGNHSIGVMSNGRVIAAGDNENGQCDVKSWSGIIAVAAGEKHSVGLRQDGTVVAAGDNSLGACDVSDWRNIVSVAAGAGFTVGVESGGKVHITGDNSRNQYDAQGFENASAISAGDFCVIALNDGRTYGFGDNEWYQLDVSAWKQIISADSGFRHSIGICADGTAYAAGDNKSGQCEVGSWTDLGLPQKAVRYIIPLD